jgi:hypothetical protein
MAGTKEMKGIAVGDTVKITLSSGPAIRLLDKMIDPAHVDQPPDEASIWKVEVVRKVGALGFLVKERMTMFRWSDENVTWKRVSGEIKS